MHHVAATRRVPGGGEERVQGTANDAAIGKLSAASLGYFQDRFLEVLVGTAGAGESARRLPPVINRGKVLRSGTGSATLIVGGAH